MKKLLELLSQRRIWAGLFGTVSVLLPMLGVMYEVNAVQLSEMFTNLFIALSALMTAVLPIWSYFKPKK